MKMLGRRDIKTTLLYTQLVHFESDDHHSTKAETMAETKNLVDAGFEYVCTHKKCHAFSEAQVDMVTRKK